MTCPRCGREQPPGESGRFCVHCGRVLSGVRWVATTPDAMRPREPVLTRLPYAGPPSYRQIPRWSLWPWAERPEPGSPDGPLPPRAATEPQEALRAHAAFLRQLAITTGVLAGVAAAGEVFRYVLLLLSRDRALSGVVLGWSDVLVTLFGLLAPVAALATGVIFLRWLLAARTVASEISGTRPWRSTRILLLGCVLPPFTLTVPGATLAEIEHAAGRDPARRPVPSRPVLTWWATWAVGVVLGILTVVQGFWTSTQALADGVELHALVDVAAVVTAWATIRVVAHLTELLAPVLRPTGRSWVVRPAAA
ncbi:DUF4328 domain-containing protein [Actinomycetospora endophytica]|uniref:DUF4328 domain-containing protein n=1 Tax=Actinomycetospora endophytica TaxID=2291215 RepID=A0ABS8P5G5_9PSEU|nr:DUF4328 domain-containing protein [Actinomycetospora endophytica]MCD2193273.1 DUF4328 domain-containing protein [Actinomycetospora endophytica]